MMSLWNVQCSGVQWDENTRTEVDLSDVCRQAGEQDEEVIPQAARRNHVPHRMRAVKLFHRNATSLRTEIISPGVLW